MQQSVSRPSPRTISATVEATFGMDRPRLFDFVAADDVLPKILTGYGFVPAIVGTSGQTGPWDQPGSARIVHLADGGVARETLTGFDRSRHFAYRVTDFTLAVRHVAAFATGDWWFEDDGAGTRLRWTYKLHAKGAVAEVLLTAFARFQWLGFMRRALENADRLCPRS